MNLRSGSAGEQTVADNLYSTSEKPSHLRSWFASRVWVNRFARCLQAQFLLGLAVCASLLVIALLGYEYKLYGGVGFLGIGQKSVLTHSESPNSARTMAALKTESELKVPSVSSPETISLPELLSACHDLADRSGDIIRAVFKTGKLQTVDKSQANPGTAGSADAVAVKDEEADDPQTIADVRSQKLIFGSLKRQWPNLQIVGEEGDLAWDKADTVAVDTQRLVKQASATKHRQLSLQDLVVWIDPLDGTREYTSGHVDAVTVLIGISYKGEALAGVIHVPFATPARTIWGITDVGAFGDVSPIKANSNTTGRRWITTSRSHMSPELKLLVESLKPQKVIQVGGAGHKVLLVLEGHADAYVYPQQGTKKWDTCAPEAILVACGGKLTDPYGDRLTYFPDKDHGNNIGLLATMADHGAYVMPRDKSNEKGKL